ncbi:hypothetical protein DPMN_017757 [Dreissena polymorpha]|uniref:Uncharacterized protein n=1 Tax=Dreissena polymorpha TaxID=45954 RepID=A0A9D4S5R3_DREPO|nr:hypothetical protein DPMN_017757 [Dreissena polymorpha]
METPTVQYFSMERRGTSLGHQWESYRDVCSPPSYITFFLKKIMKETLFLEDPSPP